MPCTETDNVRRQMLRLVELQVRPVVQSQQLEAELQLVVERQPADWMRNGRVQPLPGCPSIGASLRVEEASRMAISCLLRTVMLPTKHIATANAP
jgi:hypothetical protein